MELSGLKKLLNFIFFQIAWWAIFLLGKAIHADNYSRNLVLMLLVVLLYMVIHFKTLSTHPAQDILLAQKSLFGGFLLDGSMIIFRLLTPGSSLLPLENGIQWLALLSTLISLWTIFSLTLNSSLAALRKKPGTFILICGFLGPVSYFAPLKIGFIEYAQPQILAISIHGVFWAIWAYFLSGQRFLRLKKFSSSSSNEY